MSSRYKILPLTFPFDMKKSYWDDCVHEKNRINPIFHRNGYYYDRYNKTTWLEINGEAWQYNGWDFLYNLKTSDGNNVLHPKVLKAIELLINENIATKELKEIYYTERDRMQCRHTYRNTRLSMIKFYKRYNKEK